MMNEIIFLFLFGGKIGDDFYTEFGCVGYYPGVIHDNRCVYNAEVSIA